MRKREKDTGTQALMDQRCFNDLSVSIYIYIYALVQRISFDNDKRSENQMYSNLYQGNKELTMVTRSGDNPYLKKEGCD